MTIYLWCALTSVLVSGIVFAGFRFLAADSPKVGPSHALLAAALCLAVLAPLSAYIGDKVAVNNQLSGFVEYVNGFESEPIWERVHCERDGDCANTYRCARYTVPVQHSRRVYDGTDANGNSKYRTEYYTIWEERWHHCPLTTEEWTFIIPSTIDRLRGGPNVVASGVLPTNPNQHIWRGSDDHPGSVSSSLPSGVPAEWQAAKDRFDAGKPGPVTGIHTYDNYVVAARKNVVGEFADDAAKLRQQNLLPSLSSSTTGDWADKVYQVGTQLDEQQLQDAVMRFNAKFGTERQGDLHLVIVDADKVGDPDRYLGALQSDWGSAERGKKVVAKNALIVVLGTRNGRTVAWARAATGMPVGNDELLKRIRGQMPERDLTDVNELLGLNEGSTGLRAVVFDSETGFKRTCMVCDDPGESGSYVSLKDEIVPTGGQTAVIVLVCSLIAALVSVGVFLLPLPTLPLPRRRDSGSFGGVQ
jgi:hypothetical protein